MHYFTVDFKVFGVQGSGFKHTVCLGVKGFCLGSKQPSIEVQYRVLNFNKTIELQYWPGSQIQDFRETFLWSLESCFWIQASIEFNNIIDVQYWVSQA